MIVAVPPVMASRIAFEPPLPEPAAQRARRWKSGTVIKINFRYASAFWRDEGLSGMVMWRDIHGLFACDTSRDGEPSGTRRLRRRAAGAALASARRRQACAPSSSYGLLPRSDRRPRDFIVDRRSATGPMIAWSGGAYSDLVMDLDAHDAEAVLREGAGRVRSSPRRSCRRRSRATSKARSLREGSRRGNSVRTLSTAQSAIATSASGS